ncbi:DUF4118 domain-containing protein [Sphaerisporangium sp. NPDC049002]|uniref:sensor histidine kinase n=1 Tax=unclassified Sphaerisporangium TaxID=2630420 RepID=UPI0033C3A53D
MREGMLSPLLRTTRPPLVLGIMVGVSCVVVETVLSYLIKQVAPVTSLGMIYLIGVFVTATIWGLGLAVATALVSAVVFHYFVLWPVDDGIELVILPTFLVVALLASSITGLARSSAAEVSERRNEADLAADQARFLLRARDLRSALPEASRRLAQALDLPSASIEFGMAAADEHHTVFPLREGATVLGTLVVPSGLPQGTLRRLHRRIVPSLEGLLGAAREREAIGNALEAIHDELRRVAERQAALRRVATLVARGTSPQELFQAVASEMSRIVRAELIAVTRFEIDGTMALVGLWNGGGGLDPTPRLGSRWPVGKGGVAELVARTGRPGRVALDGSAVGGLSEWARGHDLACAVGCPIVVQGRLWGATIAMSVVPQPGDAEARMRDFTDLVATAIANAESVAELAASRARVVAATDDTRRRIERDLHDGTQQHLVSLGLELRRAVLCVPPGAHELRKRLEHAGEGLDDVVENLRELSRGLHPAILSVGGLEPAVKTLARRSGVPVELSMRDVRRLSEHVEVAIYFIVSEALTNVAKHAHASVVEVDLQMKDIAVELRVHDDGIGGSDPGHGSGLIGLRDRVEALGGRLEIISPQGGGTTLLADFPLDGARGQPIPAR